jgi:hypothetical protein
VSVDLATGRVRVSGNADAQALTAACRRPVIRPRSRPRSGSRKAPGPWLRRQFLWLPLRGKHHAQGTSSDGSGGLLVASIAQASTSIDVYRDPNCGCCKNWIKYLEANGFSVNDHVEPNMSALKQRLGVAPRLSSCHTAVIGGKFVEGMFR